MKRYHIPFIPDKMWVKTQEEAREGIKAWFSITVIKSRAAFSSWLASGSSKYVERLGNHLSCVRVVSVRQHFRAKKKKNKEAAGKRRHLEADPRTPITAPAAFDLTPLDQNPA